ncbi:Proteasome subunit alpha type-2 [Kappamyces sp. JEL0680]|nr:Proteasome subunit alpha type-2 [Kappamyces sp. JEL0680]
MGPDARVLVDKARKSAQEYKRVYMEEPPVVILVKEVAGIMQEYTQRGYSATMEIEDAVHTAILTLKEGMDGALSENLIEVGISQVQMKANRDGEIVPHQIFRSLTPEEVKDYLANIV